MNYKWGNHFVIDCEFEHQIDSIKMIICEEETMFPYPHRDSLNSSLVYFEGNVGTPDDGYPCKVQFVLFSQSEKMIIDGEEFNCNHCDVGHSYYLSEDSVSYKISP